MGAMEAHRKLAAVHRRAMCLNTNIDEAKKTHCRRRRQEMAMDGRHPIDTHGKKYTQKERDEKIRRRKRTRKNGQQH